MKNSNKTPKKDLREVIAESMQRVIMDGYKRNRTVFTGVKLSDGRTANILEVTGLDLCRANMIANGNTGAIPFIMLADSMLIDGKKVGDFSDFDNMLAYDVMACLEAVSVQLEKRPGL
jgi:hypothetical protein